MSEISHGESHARGRQIKYLEYHVDSNEFACAGEEGHWAMSEQCFNNLLRVGGVRESKAGTYAEYIKHTTESGESVPVYTDYDFFEPYRVAPGIDMWVLPGELEPVLAKIIREKHPNDLRKCVARSAVPPPDVTLEITYDDWDTAEPSKVIFSKPVPAQYSLVATRNCNLRTSKVWLNSTPPNSLQGRF